MPNRTTTYDVLGVKISVLNPVKAVHIIEDMVQFRDKGYVCVAPVSTVIDCQRDPYYREVVNNADLVTPDGMPMVWLGQQKGHRDVQRTYGPDLMRRLCEEGQARGLRHFFYGGTPEVCDRLAQRLKEHSPDLIVAGAFSPPFLPEAQVADMDILSMINRARPDILWVGLGAPKQDLWMALNRPFLDVPVMVGIGAAFDFLSGAKPQAPRWMQRAGLEWLFRLLCEPGRLWKRYLVGNTLFVWLLFREWIFKAQGSRQKAQEL